MTLSQQHRTTIYQHLVPMFGEEEAEAFMAEFPATENDQLVTKEFLRAELAELRTEMTELGGSLRVAIGALRADMHSLNARTNLTLATTVIAGMGLAAAFG